MTQEKDGRHPYESRWRTLVHVVTVQDLEDPRRARANLILPGWHTRQHVVLPLRKVPEGVRATLGNDTFFLAEVDLAAERARELRFSKFEVAPPPVPENELFS